jgi:hypothetical protein
MITISGEKFMPNEVEVSPIFSTCKEAPLGAFSLLQYRASTERSDFTTNGSNFMPNEVEVSPIFSTSALRS